MLQAAANGKGLLLIEGARVTNDPLNLKIERIADNIVVAQIQFQLAISSVENMFRHKNLRLNASIFELPKESNNPPAPERLDEPANLPDDLCNDDWIVFLHGYNVNGKQARGWHCEAFKRLFWSGSKAKFVGVSWYGDQTQVQAASVTPKYYLNVENALNTAASLSEFVNALDGGKKYLAGHSLGCLVISSAITNEGMNAEKAFMLDPALPTESLLPATTILNDIHMEPSRWRDYPEAIKTSEWYLLFPSTDARSALTWRGRLNSSVPKLKIFFSGGEEVLAALPPNIPADPGWAGDSPRGQYSFAIQAMLKGELGNEPKASEESFMGKLASILAHAWSGYSPASAHGGWRWTMGTAQPYYIIVDAGGGLTWEPPAAFAFRLDDPAFRTRLKTDPVSGLTAPDGCEDLFHPTKGNNIAADAQKARRILAQMIPERTLPAGGAGGSGVAGNNPVASLQQKFEAAQAGVIEVFDMQENRNGWPLSRPAIQPGNGWRHSDIREVAYTHVWKAWQEIVNDSGIDSDP